VALWSLDSNQWRFAPLGFGTIMHTGDRLDAKIIDGRSAEITYVSEVGPSRQQAQTTDGGQTWATRSAFPE